MYIHFAFSSLKDNPNDQLKNLIDLILDNRRLKFGENLEFIPVFNPSLIPRANGRKVVRIPLKSYEETENGVVFDVFKDNSNISKFPFNYMPWEIRIICFIKTILVELKNSKHCNEYGKIGLVFNEDFLLNNGLKEVYYYTEESLFNDPLIKEWNFNFSQKPRQSFTKEEKERKKILEKEILTYRKPAILFKGFSDSHVLVIKKRNTHLRSAYPRYSIGYNFQSENEWRIVANDNQEYLDFSESDLVRILVPDESIKNILVKYFENKWSNKPEVLVLE